MNFKNIGNLLKVKRFQNSEQPKFSSKLREKMYFLPARQVCDMDKGVVERGINVGYTKHFNTITYLRSQLDLDLLGLLLLSLTWSHYGRLDFFEKRHRSILRQ